MSTLLSICIVVYKSYSDVLEAIKTIEEYSDRSISKVIYIVDNSPEDAEGRKDFVIKLKEYLDVEYILTKGNLGFGKGHNYILPKIDSKYHAIVNPDIELRDDAFSPIIEYLDSHNDVGMVIPNIIDENGNRQLVYRKEVTVLDMFIRMFCKGLFRKHICCINCNLSRTTLLIVEIINDYYIL